MPNAGGHYRKQSVRFEQPEADPQGEVILEGDGPIVSKRTRQFFIGS